MAFRTWMIRGVILTALAGIASAVWWAHSYVRPDAVQSALIATLTEQLQDVEVHVGSARMRVFGGISVTDLRVTRPGSQDPLFHAPTAIIYHDKEAINRGRLTIRKVELDGPSLRLECSPEGVWNFSGLARESESEDLVPTFVITNATVDVIDHRPGGIPPLRLTGAKLNVLNDPVSLIRAEGHAHIQVTGTEGEPGLAVRAAVSLRMHRETGDLQASLDIPDFTFAAGLANLLTRFQPDAATHLQGFQCQGAMHADIRYQPGAAIPLDYSCDLTVRAGRFEHKQLPAPIESIASKVHIRNGQVTIPQATARLGPAQVELSLATRDPDAEPLPAAQDLLGEFEASLAHLNLAIRGIPLDEDLIRKFPPEGMAHKLNTMFNPRGSVSLGYRFLRSPAGEWTRAMDLKPEQLQLVYDKFRYPVESVTGAITKLVNSTGKDEMQVALTGMASGQKVEIQGTIRGEGEDPEIDLKIAGTNLPINDRLFNAIPNEKYRQALHKLHARGRGDFVAEIRQTHGINLTQSTFRIKLYDSSLRYDYFPYPLEQIRGKIVIQIANADDDRPIDPAHPERLPPDDRIEFHEIEARHGHANFAMTGETEPISGTEDQRVKLRIWGRNCPMDDTLRQALAELGIDGVWRSFDPRGDMTFGVDVDIIDRAPMSKTPRRIKWGPAMRTAPGIIMQVRDRLRHGPMGEDPPFDPARDLKLVLNFSGPSVKPTFFPYLLDRVAGRVRVDGNHVRVEHFTADHGPSQWKLNAGEVRFAPDGRIWTNIGRLDVAPLVVDEAFREALPQGLRSAVEQLQLEGSVTARLNHLVVSTPPDPARTDAEGIPVPLARGQSPGSGLPGPEPIPDPEVYWNGELRMAGARFHTGLEWDQAQGVIHCAGRYHGTHMGDVTGSIWMDRATIENHPISRVSVRFRARPQVPDPDQPEIYQPTALEFVDLNGTMFRGTVTGEARVVLTEPTRYRLWLTASNVSLAEVARHHNLGNGAKLEGVAQGRLEIQTVPDPLTGKDSILGSGSVDVTQGNMLNLPVLMPLLKTLKLQAPDKTAFEEGHATFTVSGDRIRVDHLDLLGTAVSLGGSGELDTSGRYVKFEFYTIWSQTLQRWLTTPLGDVSAFVSEQLFKIEVTRDLNGDLKYEPRVVPFVTSPFRAIAERVRRQKHVTDGPWPRR